MTASHHFEDEYVDVSLEQNFSQKLGILMKNISYFDYTKHDRNDEKLIGSILCCTTGHCRDIGQVYNLELFWKSREADIREVEKFITIKFRSREVE